MTDKRIIYFAILLAAGFIGVGLNQDIFQTAPSQYAFIVQGQNSKIVSTQSVVRSGFSFTPKTTSAAFGTVKKLAQDVISASKASNLIQSETEKSQKQALVKSLAAQRKESALKLMKENPVLFSAIAVKKNERRTLSPEIQKDVEEEVTLTGTVKVLHVDDFNRQENSRFEYILSSQGKEYSLYATKPIAVSSGARVKVKGFRLDNVLAADGGQNAIEVQFNPPLPPESIGNQRTLVLLLTASSSLPVPFSRERAHDLVFNGQFQSFMDEQSYNQVSFSGDIYGWIELPRATGCTILYGDELSQIARTYNIDFNKYDRIVSLIGSTGYGGCSGVGKWNTTINGVDYKLSHASVGAQDTTDYSWGNPLFPWSAFDFVLSHEMGHSLGVYPANGWECGNEIIYGDCQHLEYGNIYDTMGFGNYSLHFNAFYKELLGWIPPQRVLNITTSGTYTINPLEKNSDSAIALAKVKIKNSQVTPFYIENRRATGFDANLEKDDLRQNQEGLFINRIVRFSPALSDGFPRLLDMSPHADADTIDSRWWEDIKQSTLNRVGPIESSPRFVDKGRGITIGPIRNVSPSSITFDVALTDPLCVRRSPTSVGYYAPPRAVVGGYAYMNVYFTNGDYFGCGPSTFRFQNNLPPGWVLDGERGGGVDVSLAPDEHGYFNAGVFRVPQNELPGMYEIETEIINNQSGLSASVHAAIEVVPPPVIDRIIPQSGPIGTSVRIEGSGFIGDSQGQVGVNIYEGMSGVWVSLAVQPIDSNTIIFTVPATVQRCTSGNPCETIPTPLGQYYIYVSTSESSSNNVTFRVSSSETELTVLSPNGGEIFGAGHSMTVTWISDNYPSDKSVEIYISRSPTGDPVGERLQTARVLNTGTMTWTISPDIPLGKYYIRIECVGISPCAGDASDESFAIDTFRVVTPNGGERWQLGSVHKVSWLPEPDSRSIIAYLDQLVDGKFVTVGQILEAARGSIYWLGDVGTLGNYPKPGFYYVRVVNNETGEIDRSDKPFEIVPFGTVKVDMKINGVDGPLQLGGGGNVQLSWTSSNADRCALNSAGYNGHFEIGIDYIAGLPPTGTLSSVVSSSFEVTAHGIGCSSDVGDANDQALAVIEDRTP